MASRIDETSLSARPVAPLQAYRSGSTLYRLILRYAAFAFSDASGSSCKHEGQGQYSRLDGRVLGNKPIYPSPTHRIAN